MMKKVKNLVYILLTKTTNQTRPNVMLDYKIFFLCSFSGLQKKKTAS